ncbi:hypothetical protein [Brevundimonas lutea]|uniref:hypothetical protein n=1 Tax=Brevundimonas lutea TaxID=2293980 RepID=UPI000F01FCC9|nr:hypothetical protein [Brevundimonas lutea]
MRNLSMRRLTLMFAACFAVVLAGIFAFEHFFADPRDRCEAEGGWYDLSGRECAIPIYIPDITGREPGESREAASRRQAQDLVEIERRIAAGEAARDAEAAAQREALKEG